MSKTFDNLGVRFDYPENWDIDRDEMQDSDQIVSVYGPNESFWSLQINPLDVEPQEMVDQALKVMQDEYEGLESEPVSEAVGGHELTGYNMNFICLDLTNTAQVRAFRNEAASYLIFCQAEDRDYATVKEVFAAITATLIEK